MYLDMKDLRELFDPNQGLWYRDATAKAQTTGNGELSASTHHTITDSVIKDKAS